MAPINAKVAPFDVRIAPFDVENRTPTDALNHTTNDDSRAMTWTNGPDDARMAPLASQPARL